MKDTVIDITIPATNIPNCAPFSSGKTFIKNDGAPLALNRIITKKIYIMSIPIDSKFWTINERVFVR